MKKHVLIDIEALGLRPGSAIIELAAVEFFPETGWIGTGFEAMIEPQAPFTADLETLAWHGKQGTWPRPFAEGSHSIGSALADFGEWVRGLGEIEEFWSWGSTYDFPLLDAGYDFAGFKQPWNHWEVSCARTIWKRAFGKRKHGPRPHRALDDAKAAAVDLMAAMDALHGKGAE